MRLKATYAELPVHPLAPTSVAPLVCPRLARPNGKPWHSYHACRNLNPPCNAPTVQCGHCGITTLGHCGITTLGHSSAAGCGAAPLPGLWDVPCIGMHRKGRRALPRYVDRACIRHRIVMSLIAKATGNQ